MTFRGTTTTSLDVIRDLIDDVDALKRQVGSIKQNTIRLGDWVVEMESDTVIKTTNLSTGAVSYIGLPGDPSDNVFDQKWSYSGIVKPTANTSGQKWPCPFDCQISSLWLTLQTASSTAYSIRTYVNNVLQTTSVLPAGSLQQEFSMHVRLRPGDILYPMILTAASGTGTQLGIVYRIKETI
jgi:hypothetical protein